MKKYLYILSIAGLALTTASCDDFLDTSSPSVTDPEFVLTDPSNCRAALTGAYSTWEDRANCIHSGGFMYDLAVGSDIERHAESHAKQTQRTIPEAFYPNVEDFSIDYANAEKAWGNLYKIIAVCNNIIATIEKSEAFAGFVADQPTELSQIYGEAVTMRATCYHELCRHFGDVPYKTQPGEGATAAKSRWAIWESEIDKVVTAQAYMRHVGQDGQTANTMSRTYAQGLIGRMCLYAGGYSTRRTDDKAPAYVNAAGDVLVFEDIATSSADQSAYGRVQNYKDFYETAETYLQLAVNSNAVSLITVDDRTTEDGGKTYGNPYQRKYQYMLDRQISPEAIYEIPYQQGVAGSERPYNFGRGSDGGSKNAYPCKTFGQQRFMPTYYYGEFDPKDMRRDVTITVTGSNGKGQEILTTLSSGSKGSGGGLMLNKWDENRMATPYTKAQRQSGVSCQIMAFDDILLMLAEAKAVNGTGGRDELAKVRNRAFNGTAPAVSGSLFDQIIEERKFEFGGEGYRRYDLIRTGKLYSEIAATRTQMAAVISALETQGYYTFENGNQFPAYIWTKSVDAKAEYGWRLTTQTPAGSEEDHVLAPGWRGQYDSWETLGCAYGDNPGTNLAIAGLFRYIDPAGAEAAELEAQGYEKKDWGATILTDEMKTEYTTNWMCGMTSNVAPRHLCPFSTTILEQNPLLSNGYGFANPVAE